MSAAAKLNRDPVVENDGDKMHLRDDATALFFSGMDRIAEVQKQFIDAAVQHTVDTVETLRKATERVPGMPRLPLLEVTSGAVSRYADTQKAAIDFVIEQSHVWMDMFKDRTSAASKSNESTSSMAKQALERSFAVQKKALEHTAAQTKAVMDATRRQFGLTGTQAETLTDTFQRSINTVVDAQKELLDLVTH